MSTKSTTPKQKSNRDYYLRHREEILRKASERNQRKKVERHLSLVSSETQPKKTRKRRLKKEPQPLRLKFSVEQANFKPEIPKNFYLDFSQDAYVRLKMSSPRIIFSVKQSEFPSTMPEDLDHIYTKETNMRVLQMFRSSENIEDQSSENYQKASSENSRLKMEWGDV